MLTCFVLDFTFPIFRQKATKWGQLWLVSRFDRLSSFVGNTVGVKGLEWSEVDWWWRALHKPGVPKLRGAPSSLPCAYWIHLQQAPSMSSSEIAQLKVCDTPLPPPPPATWCMCLATLEGFKPALLLEKGMGGALVLVGSHLRPWNLLISYLFWPYS